MATAPSGNDIYRLPYIDSRTTGDAYSFRDYIIQFIGMIDTFHDFGSSDIKEIIKSLGVSFVGGLEYIERFSNQQNLINNFKSIPINIIQTETETIGQLLTDIKNKNFRLNNVNEKWFKTIFSDQPNSPFSFCIDYLKSNRMILEYPVDNINFYIINDGEILLKALHADVRSINKKKILKYRNLIYYIVKNIRTYNPSAPDQNLKYILIKQLLELFIHIFNLSPAYYDIVGICEYFKKNRIYNLTYPSSYIYDAGKIDFSNPTMYRWLLNNHNDVDPGNHLTQSTTKYLDKIHDVIYFDTTHLDRKSDPIISSNIDLDINYSLILTINNENHYCTWGIKKDSDDQTKINFMFISDKLDPKDEKDANNNHINVVYKGSNSITDITREIIDKRLGNAYSDPILTGYKRLGDWYQALYASKYNLLLSTNDYWAEKYAILVGCPIISKYYNFYNGNNLDTELSVIYLQEKHLRPTDPTISSNIHNSNGDGEQLSFNVHKYYMNENLYIVDGTTPISLPLGIIPYIINKYLKYKLKYFKKKNPNLKINQNIENQRIKLMNDKTVNYDSLYQKYIKYKNKYKKLTI
jgi:hypothetical protein